MKKWTKEHARFIGRIIFADFLELPLEKYKRFIEKVEASPLFEKHRCAQIIPHQNKTYRAGSRQSGKRCRLSQIAKTGGKESSKIVAKIVKSGETFSIRYTYEGFNTIYDTCGHLFQICDHLWHKLRRISSRNELTHKILKGIISHQRRYLTTGNPADLIPFSQVQLPIDNSWTSRLVNRLSVITPSGEEKPIKWFFQTQKDINKRLIKKLLDRENEDIESGRLKKPLTDNQIRADLEKDQGLSLSRWSVGHCRKDMGIPPASMRLSGYKYPPLSANFSMIYPLTMESVMKHAPDKSGIYELNIKNNTRTTNYDSRTTVFYIGSTRNIRKRLREHLGKNSKNGHIREFLKKYECSFRYISFKKDWQEEEKRLYKLFMDTYGSRPRCNRVRP